MGIGYDDTDYMYSSARVRALETRMISKEDFELLLSARGRTAVTEQLRRMGIGGDTSKKGDTLSDAPLDEYLSRAIADIAEVLPDRRAVEFFRYKYDCNNLKLAQKCYFRGIGIEEELSLVGSVEPCEVVRAVKEGDYPAFPKNLAVAAPEAYAEFLHTRDARRIDFILDRATFRDILGTAKAIRVPFAREYVELDIDLTNALICVRILRSDSERTGRVLAEKSLIGGGKLTVDFWLDSLSAGENELWKRLREGGVLSSFSAACGERSTLSKLGKMADNERMRLISRSKALPFGAELSISYIAALEMAMKNLRIILFGNAKRTDGAIIRERMREVYV